MPPATHPHHLRTRSCGWRPCCGHGPLTVVAATRPVRRAAATEVAQAGRRPGLRL